jgi:hypothetical protein
VGSDPAAVGGSSTGLASGVVTGVDVPASASNGARSARTPRPTNTPLKKMTTDTTVATMNRNTSCFPFS